MSALSRGLISHLRHHLLSSSFSSAAPPVPSRFFCSDALMGASQILHQPPGPARINHARPAVMTPNSKRTGLITIKCDMTVPWDKRGARLPISIPWVNGNIVSQVKTVEKEGIFALQKRKYATEIKAEMEEASDGETDSDEATSDVHRDYSPEEKEAEAAAIGYKVVSPLQRCDRVFKEYEPVFAVVQIGSHQFKVCNGDSIFTERLKFCEVNDKLILNKVLLLGSPTQTIIGRPILPDAAVHAVVEEHALDAKVIIFKKKRRKNYRRTKGHRQELTKLRITDIQGIEKPEMKLGGSH